MKQIQKYVTFKLCVNLKDYLGYLLAVGSQIPLQMTLIPGNDDMIRFVFDKQRRLLEDICEGLFLSAWYAAIGGDEDVVVQMGGNLTCVADIGNREKIHVYPKGESDLDKDGYIILKKDCTYTFASDKSTLLLFIEFDL